MKLKLNRKNTKASNGARPVILKHILEQYDIKPNKKLGQNFLTSDESVNKVIATAELQPTDTVLEIGSGLGALTLAIADQVEKVIAMEKDKKFVGALSNILQSQNINNVELIHQDILKYQTPNIKNYKIIANLPYNIATAVVMKFLQSKNPPETMVVMLQKEVGQRMCSKPPNMSRLSVFCQFYAKCKTIGYINKHHFYPRPKVDSAIVKITEIQKILPQTNYSSKFVKSFEKIVRAGFSQPRKQLINNLSNELKLLKDKAKAWLEQNNIKPSQRAETLNIENWLTLVTTYPQAHKI